MSKRLCSGGVDKGDLTFFSWLCGSPKDGSHLESLNNALPFSLLLKSSIERN